MKRKPKKNYQTPKPYVNKKQTNPPTIISSDIYTEEDTTILANLNIFPLIVKGNFEKQFFTIADNDYYILSNQEEKEEKYACLDVFSFLKKFEVESDIKLLLTGRENPNIHHCRLVDNDIIICTDYYKIPLSKIIKDTIYMYGKSEPEKVKIKTRN